MGIQMPWDRAMASLRNLNEPLVNNKYRILDANTGVEKQGKYFVLKIDSEDPIERVAVASALREYARCHDEFDNTSWAAQVRQYIVTKKRG